MNTAATKDGSMKAYVISAGQYESILRARGDRPGKTLYRTIDEALAVLGPVLPNSMVTVDDCEGGQLVYASQADADFDDDGSDPIATIRDVGPEHFRTLHSQVEDLCGPDDAYGSIQTTVQTELERDLNVTAEEIAEVVRQATADAALDRAYESTQA